jgi:hypothetical protein
VRSADSLAEAAAAFLELPPVARIATGLNGLAKIEPELDDALVMSADRGAIRAVIAVG